MVAKPQVIQAPEKLQWQAASGLQLPCASFLPLPAYTGGGVKGTFEAGCSVLESPNESHSLQ